MTNGEPALPTLPDYTVRVSPRAKHARLTISPAEGLVVIVPRGFDKGRIPEILAARRSWVQRHLGRLRDHRRQMAGDAAPLPDVLRLEAIGESWPVDYRGMGNSRPGAYEQAGNRLMVTGDPGDHTACRAALRRWLSRKAYRHFEPWLQGVSLQTGLGYQRMIIRGQKTRWGSCSHNRTISINYKLLFFPPHLVRYVFLHELCHTRVMNHSPPYWRTLAALEPRYTAYHQQMREAWRFVPPWVQMP